MTLPVGLFGRAVAVEIGPEGAPGIRLADLRVSFKVEFKASKTVSTASIRVYNPSTATIGRLRVPLATIRLLVGYNGAPRLLFAGGLVKDGIDLKVEGPDRILDVDASDGGRGYATFIQVSFSTPTTFGQVLALVLAQTQWSQGFVDPRVSNVVLPHGVVLVGRPAEVMDRLAAAVPAFGADWFVRDNALYVVVRGGTTPEVGPLISAEAGNLIGSPNGTKKGVKVRALIDATMRPGRSFVLQSAAWNGTFVCKDVTFNGDSGFDNPFYMDITSVSPGVP